MRCDWFLPYLRKAKPDRLDRSVGAVRRLAGQVLPASWFSNRDSKLRGRVRKFLRWLGPVWTGLVFEPSATCRADDVLRAVPVAIPVGLLAVQRGAGVAISGLDSGDL